MVIKISGVWGHPLEHGELTREHTHNKELFSLPTAPQWGVGLGFLISAGTSTSSFLPRQQQLLWLHEQGSPVLSWDFPLFWDGPCALGQRGPLISVDFNFEANVIGWNILDWHYFFFCHKGFVPAVFCLALLPATNLPSVISSSPVFCPLSEPCVFSLIAFLDFIFHFE